MFFCCFCNDNVTVYSAGESESSCLIPLVDWNVCERKIETERGERRVCVSNFYSLFTQNSYKMNGIFLVKFRDVGPITSREVTYN